HCQRRLGRDGAHHRGPRLEPEPDVGAERPRDRLRVVARRPVDLDRRRAHREAGVPRPGVAAAVDPVARRQVMRLAAIDCGTNTLLLLVADFEDGQIAAVEDRAEIVRLGEGLDASGALQPRAIARALATLDGYVARIGELGCAHVMAVGTEAIRRASNGHLFVNEATARLGRVGGRFQVIDGEREARLSWRAVNASFPELRGARTVLDIGGGSTELLVGEHEVERVVSLPIGSVRLTERLLHHDPPLADERAALHAAIERALDEAPPPRGTLVGIAGTVTTLAAM